MALPSGLGTLMKGSMSPTAGMYSGMNGRIFVSSSMLCGLYLERKEKGVKSVRKERACAVLLAGWL